MKSLQEMEGKVDLNFVRGDHRTVSVIFIGMGFLGGGVYQTLSLLPPPQFLSDTVSVASSPVFIRHCLCCPLPSFYQTLSLLPFPSFYQTLSLLPPLLKYQRVFTLLVPSVYVSKGVYSFSCISLSVSEGFYSFNSICLCQRSLLF